MLVVSMCKPVIHKLKILGVEKLEYYKSMGNHKKRGTKFWNFSGLEAKKGGQDFWLEFSGGNIGENYGMHGIDGGPYILC